MSIYILLVIAVVGFISAFTHRDWGPTLVWALVLFVAFRDLVLNDKRGEK